jgi:hypothetical protein
MHTNTFRIQLYNKERFRLLEQDVGTMTNVVDKDGEDQYLVAEDQVPCDEETYKRVAGWQISWH